MNKNFNYKSHVSRGDIYLDGPVKRSEAGMPIGNGIMGSLVWTEPESMKFQINRSDVFAMNSETNSFPQRCTDYSYTCGYVDIDFLSYENDLFTRENLKQHLDIYDAVLFMDAKDVKCRVMAWHNKDVMMIEVEDNRENTATTLIRLRMMRPPYVVTKNHLALSELSKGEKGIFLTQEFKEGKYICSSALAIDVKDRAYKVIQNSDTEFALYLKPGKGKYTIVIGSAASFDKKEVSFNNLLLLMKETEQVNFNDVLKDNQNWWHKYWSKGYVHLNSKDGRAEVVESRYTYFLYLMASCSRRGKFAPNYGGLIWSTRGDLRAWGSQYWWNNMSSYYNGLLPSNRLEIMDPYFNMYRNMYDSLSLAARQQWGSKGVYIPETTFFDGLEELPEDIAEEMTALYTLQRPWGTRSQKFLNFAHNKHPQNARWNWKAYGRYVNGNWEYDEREKAPFGRVVHLFASGGSLAYQYWKRYLYSQDKNWLKEIGYPMIKGITEFFRNFPNFKRDNEGIYHIYLINDQESLQGATDTMSVMIVLHLIFPAAIKAARVLGVDNDLIKIWQEVFDNLAPLPISTNPRAMQRSKPGEKPYFVNALYPSYVISKGISSRPADGDLCTLETKETNPEMFETTLHSYKLTHPDHYGPDAYISPVTGTKQLAHLGLVEDFKNVLYNLAIFHTEPRKIRRKIDAILYKAEKNIEEFENRLSLVEGFNAVDAQRLGNLTGGLHAGLLQDGPGSPDLEPVIRVFPTWPDEWDAEFKLLTSGGFIVSASKISGNIERVELLSQFGGTCRIRNPWGDKMVNVYINENKLFTNKESMIVIKTNKDDKIKLSL